MHYVFKWLLVTSNAFKGLLTVLYTKHFLLLGLCKEYIDSVKESMDWQPSQEKIRVSKILGATGYRAGQECPQANVQESKTIALMISHSKTILYFFFKYDLPDIEAGNK